MDLAIAICRDVRSEDIIEAALRTLRDAFPEFRASFWTLDRDDRLRAYRSLEPSTMAPVEDLEFPATACPAFTEAVRNLRPIVVRDIDLDERVGSLREAMHTHGTAAILDVPVLQADGTVGLLSLDAPRCMPWNAHHIGLLSDMAAMVSVALKDAQARQERAAAHRAEMMAAARLRAVLECAPTGLLLEDELGHVRFANRPLCTLLGVDGDPDTLVGRAVNEVLAPLTPSAVAPVDPAHGSDTDVEPTHDVVHLRGGRLVERDRVPVMVDGARMGRLWQYRDTTERRDREQRLLLAERLASLGTLAAGIGHEINNPLTFVLGNLEAVREDLVSAVERDPEGLADTLDALEDALTGVKRIAGIVRELSTHAKKDSSDDAVSLSGVVAWATRLADNEVRHRAQLRIELPDDLPRVRGSETKLGQVLVNLLVNAARAIPEGHAAKHTITIRASREGPGSVRVEVEDTGVGIAPEDRPRVFDPFYTRFAEGRGTGLGLFLTQGMIRSMGGRIDLESELGVGTCVTLVLQAEDAATASAEPPTASARRTSSTSQSR